MSMVRVNALLLQDDSARMVNPNTGKTIISIPPQLASQSVISCTWSNFSQTLYMLLSNSVVHVWQSQLPEGPAQLVAIWTEHRRSHLVTISISTKQTIPHTQQRLWGMSPAMPGDEFLFGGTLDGDVWVMDRHASAQLGFTVSKVLQNVRFFHCILMPFRSTGSQLVSFCAHKLCSLKIILCDPRNQRVLTIAGAQSKFCSAVYEPAVVLQTSTSFHTNCRVCRKGMVIQKWSQVYGHHQPGLQWNKCSIMW